LRVEPASAFPQGPRPRPHRASASMATIRTVSRVV
jgi:hypothetical protein